ncbi:diaminopimelate decarboxylase [bacterium]|nr:diaminopimelate decarboxylase [bacterium]
MKNTPNQNIKPLTLNRNSDFCLEIGGCDMQNLAAKFGTPLYIYDEQTIRQIAKDYKNAFNNYPKVNMMYASKAFMVQSVAKLLDSEGFGFDLVSGGEIYTVLSAGLSIEKSVFNGSNKNYDEILLAIENNIGRISVDNFIEMAMVDLAAKSLDKKVNILLRITPGIECHTHEYIQTGHLDSKFGFDLTQIDEAIELINDEYENLVLKGLHAHIGSQIFETKVYYDEIEVLLKEIRRIKDKYDIELSEINIGGGLGIKYNQDDTPPSIYEMADVILKSIEDNTRKYGLEKPLIYIEPGRSIVGTSGVTLYTVGSSKQVPNGRKYVAVDGGMADNPRPSMYQAVYTADKVEEEKCEEKETVTIAGRFCESGDILIKDITLPKLNAGDLLCVYNTGAYGYSMSSNYNRVLKPAAVLVNNGQADIIVERETYEHLVSLDKIPERLNRYE